MIVYHNSHDQAYRAPFGAVACGTTITLALDLLEAAPGYSCVLRYWRIAEGERLYPMTSSALPEGGFRFHCSIDAPKKPGLVWYQFQLTAPDGHVFFYCNNPDGLGGEGVLCPQQGKSYQVTVYHPAPVPEWYKRAVVYQVFPDRFARGKDYPQRFLDAQHPDDWVGAPRLLQTNWQDQPFYTRDSQNKVTHWGFFGGTLEGIREKLPYLRDLGISAIYLNPIFEAYSNHRYDTANYLKIDPILGDEEGFRQLASEARDMGIRLILDGVFSHTGADSIYFNRYGNYPDPGACQTESPYDSWYRFRSFPDDYESWWGVEDLPNVNELEPSYLKYILGPGESVIRHWIRCGASGWRLDVADELPDAFIAALRKALKEEDPDALLMGEVWEDAINKYSYDELRQYLLGYELDATMHYPFRTSMLDFFLGRADSQLVARKMMQLLENYPPENYYGALNLIGSHDRARVLTLLGGASEQMTEAQMAEFRLSPEARRLAIARLHAAALLQFTAAGVPCIYYGDEAGMEGGSDPFNRGPFPWGREDKALTAYYKSLISLRKDHEAFISGSFQAMAPHPDIYGCLRKDEKEQLLVLVNRSQDSREISLPFLHGTTKLFGTGSIGTDRKHSNLYLPPLGTIVLQMDE